MIEADRLISAGVINEEEVIDRAIRPQRLSEYVGQLHVRQQMEIFITAAKQRAESDGSCADFRSAGLGKTTLANIVANEMGVNLRRLRGRCWSAPETRRELTNLSP